MVDYTDPTEQERLETYLSVHLKKEFHSEPPSVQIEELNKRIRNKWIQLAVNVAAILFFGYSFYFDITQLSQTFMIVIVAVFGINVGLIFFQKKQIDELVDFLQWKKEQESQ